MSVRGPRPSIYRWLADEKRIVKLRRVQTQTPLARYHYFTGVTHALMLMWHMLWKLWPCQLACQEAATQLTGARRRRGSHCLEYRECVSCMVTLRGSSRYRSSGSAPTSAATRCTIATPSCPSPVLPSPVLPASVLCPPRSPTRDRAGGIEGVARVEARGVEAEGGAAGCSSLVAALGGGSCGQAKAEVR